MVDKEKIKKFLFDDLRRLDLSTELPEKVGCDVMEMVNTYAKAMAETIKNSGTDVEDKIGGAILVGCLLKSFMDTEEQRERFENIYTKSESFNDIENMYNQYPKTTIENVPKDFVDDFKNNKKPKFISYDEFFKVFSVKSNNNKALTCNEIKEMFHIKNKIDCIDIKCMSLQCYNCFREAYYGE